MEVAVHVLEDDDVSVCSDLSDDELYKDDPALVPNPIAPDERRSAPFEKHYLWTVRGNKKAREVMGKVVTSYKDDVQVLDETHAELWIPGSPQEKNLQRQHAMEGEARQIYFIPRNDSDEWKGGSTVRGDHRVTPYKENPLYDHKRAQVSIPFDRLRDESAELLRTSVAKIAKIKGAGLEGVDIEGLTVEAATELENEGAPMPTRLVTHGLNTDDKTQKFGNASDLQGVYSRWTMNCVEGATVEYVRDVYRVPMKEGTNPNEHLQGSGMRWVTEAGEADQAHLTSFMRETEKKTGREWLQKEQKRVIQNAWAPAIDNPGKSVTGTIWDAIENQQNIYDEGVYGNAFSRLPRIIDGNSYNAKEGFVEDDRKEARERQRGALSKLKTEGGWGFFNVASEAHRGKDSSIFGYLDDLGYKCYHQYLDFQAFHVQNDGGEHSVAVVFNPLCDIFHSSTNTWDISWHSLVRQALKARTANVLQGLIWFLREPSDDLEAKVNASFWQNFLVAFYVRVWALKNLHLHPFVATKMGEECLDKWRNMLSSEHHGLAASKYGDFKRQQRRKLEKEKRDNAAKRKTDDEIHRHVVDCISRSRSDEDLDECIVAAADQYVWNVDADGTRKPRPIGNVRKLLKTLKKRFLHKDDNALQRSI